MSPDRIVTRAIAKAKPSHARFATSRLRKIRRVDADPARNSLFFPPPSFPRRTRLLRFCRFCKRKKGRSGSRSSHVSEVQTAARPGPRERCKKTGGWWGGGKNSRADLTSIRRPSILRRRPVSRSVFRSKYPPRGCQPRKYGRVSTGDRRRLAVSSLVSLVPPRTSLVSLGTQKEVVHRVAFHGGGAGGRERRAAKETETAEEDRPTSRPNVHP